MLGRVVINKKRSDEAEKPFWISFSDLMTALMVLFLVVMTISLLSVTRQVRDMQKDEVERTQAIERIVSDLKNTAGGYNDVKVVGNRDRVLIKFGKKVNFASNNFHISSEGKDALRAFVPEILKMAQTEGGKRWFKRVIVEGFTDPTGTYLHNLHLSLMRAESVVCALLSEESQDLTEEQKKAIRSLFLVGGFSSNSTLATHEESRRVELRLDFLMLREKRQPNFENTAPVGHCKIR